ncbi:MAG: formate dehydrogenase accessory sulfurtransferase FdhD [bacterium]|nr:formate dehydrogenase accessory sulfurtransferase FdhD [bacterium]
MTAENEGVVRRSVTKVRDGRLEQVDDAVAVEEPLEIRVAGDRMAVTMRTPGHDERLALGFLFSEGIIGSIHDVGRVYHCGRPGAEDFGNVIDVLPAPGTSLDVERVALSRRGTLTTSACGVCGRQSVQDLIDRCEPLADGPVLNIAALMDMVGQLRSHQVNFAETGGVHAAGLFAADGHLLACYEDVGRHNAVDKAVGALLMRDLIGAGTEVPHLEVPTVLVVSGRASFEIIQKAAGAGIPFVISVSAASSLAVDLASKVGLTLIGFLRGKTCNLYTCPERVRNG